MPDIVLLCSVHKDNGKCSSKELVRILELIKPDVLFQEVSYTEHSGNDSILEIRAIAEYLTRNSLQQIPVDTLGGSAIENENLDPVIKRVSRISPTYRSAWDNYIHPFENTRGFEYLNSRLSDYMLRQVDSIITTALEQLNDAGLLKVYAEWKLYNSQREDAMVRNVYEFCRFNDFKKGVFLFGSAHRLSLIRKIQAVKRTEKVRVNWRLNYGQDKLLPAS